MKKALEKPDRRAALGAFAPWKTGTTSRQNALSTKRLRRFRPVLPGLTARRCAFLLVLPGDSPYIAAIEDCE